MANDPPQVHENDVGSRYSLISPGGWCAPEHAVELDGEFESDLDLEQERRVSALYQARGILERRGGVMAGASASTPPPVSDLLTVACFILSGVTP